MPRELQKSSWLPNSNPPASCGYFRINSKDHVFMKIANDKSVSSPALGTPYYRYALPNVENTTPISGYMPKRSFSYPCKLCHHGCQLSGIERKPESTFMSHRKRVRMRSICTSLQPFSRN